MKQQYTKNIAILLILGVVLCVLSGCKSNSDVPGDTIKVFYYNQGKNNIVGYEYGLSVLNEKISDSQTDDLVSFVMALENLMKQPGASSYRTTFNENIMILDRRVDAGLLKIYLDEKYLALASTEDVMFRASYVLTMTALDGIDKVSFYINGENIKDALGNPISDMGASDFAYGEDIGTGLLEWTEIRMYYGDPSCQNLAYENMSVGYGNDASVIKAVADKLLLGPSSKNCIAVIPEGVICTKAELVNNICYIWLDMSNVPKDVEFGELAIYSIVNTMCEITDVEGVILNIDNSSSIVLTGYLGHEYLYKANFDLVKEE